VPAVGSRFYTFLANDVVIWALFATSLNLLVGYTGLVSFGHAAYFGIGAYTTGILMKQAAVPFFLAFPAAGVVAGLFAVVFGFFCVRLTRIYFAMLTLAFAQFLYTVAYKWRSLTGGSDGIAGVPKTALFWGGPSLASPHAFYFLATACVVLSLVLCRALVRSPFGRALQAIRENEQRFGSLGRDPRPFKLVVFVIAAVFAGLAGALFAPFRGFASPEVMFWVFSGQGLMMVTIGGIGTLVGPILGAMVFILLQEILSSYTEHWMIFTGVVFVLIVIFLPGGLVGSARRLGLGG
jgi:branched-chain amino acid transport system permease protein